MESTTATLVTYSLKEKFFQVEPEGRIRRYQYLVRILAPAFILVILFFILGFVLSGVIVSIVMYAYSYPIIAGVIWALISGGLSWILYKVSSSLAIKRSHDFGSDGKIAKNIVLASFILQLVGIALGLLTTFGILGGVDTMDIMNYSNPMYLTILSVAQGIVGIVGLVMGIILLFRPGNTGDNAYGKDPINTKVAFLG